MKAFVIVIRDNEISEQGFDNILDSAARFGNTFPITGFEAITPDYVREVMKDEGVEWRYPWDEEEIDIATGLVKKPYPTKNRLARMSCAMSHYLLWQLCKNSGEPLIILEHDALFIDQIDFVPDEVPANILGLNNPIGATRRAQLFDQQVQSSAKDYPPVPKVDEFNIPQGLAGNSAYMIKPQGAYDMINLVKTHGMWPNDALMCKQLVEGLAVSKKYYTTVQGLRSTTTL